MTDFYIFLLKDLVMAIVVLGTSIAVNSILHGKKLNDVLLQGVFVAVTCTGFCGQLATHYGSIHSFAAKMVAAVMAITIVSIGMPIIKYVQYKRAKI